MAAVDEGAIAQFSNDDRLALFCWALQLTGAFVLAKRCMTVEEFIEWCLQRHEAHGSLLVTVGLTAIDDAIDWETACGMFTLVVPGDAPEYYSVTEVRYNSTGCSCKLPMSIHMSTLGFDWHIRDNFCSQLATLVSKSSGQTQLLSKLFERSDTARHLIAQSLCTWICFYCVCVHSLGI